MRISWLRGITIVPQSIFAFLALSAGCLMAEPSMTAVDVPLWPGRAHPSMRVVSPSRSQGRLRPAMLVFQGGGYSTCFGSGDGSAEWLGAQGIVGIRVEYRTRQTGDAHPA